MVRKWFLGLAGLILVQVFVVNVVFAQSWWKKEYKYRQQVSILATADTYSGYAVKTTVDINTLKSANKVRSDLKDLRFVYWNGSSNQEIARYVNGNDVWFKLQSNISSGDIDKNYYIYYGNSSETNSPISGPTDIFTQLSGTFTRNDNNTFANVASYINDNNTLLYVAKNVPRFTNRFNLTTGTGKGILIEQTTINGITLYDQFESEFLATGTITQNVETSPQGIVDADRAVITGGANRWVDFYADNVYLQTQNRIVSIYLKSTSSDSFKFGTQDGNGNYIWADTSFTLGTTSWKRYAQPIPSGTQVGGLSYFIADVPISTFYTWGIQIEANRKYVTSVIPRLTGDGGNTGTRSADILIYPVSTVLKLPTNTKGTISVWIKPEWNGTDSYDTSSTYTIINCNGDTGINLIATPVGGPGAGAKIVKFTVGGGTPAIAQIGSWTGETWYYITGTYDSSGVKLYVNGTQTGTTGTLGTGTLGSDSLHIGSDNNNSNQLNGISSNLLIYNRVLSQSEISSLGSNVETSQPVTNGAVLNISFQGSLTGYSRGAAVEIEPSILLSSTEGNIIGSLGGEVLAADDPQTKLIIPANRFDKDMSFKIEKVLLPPEEENKKPINSYEITATDTEGKEIKSFSSPLTIIIHAKSDDGNIINNSSIRVSDAKTRLGLGFWNGLHWVLIQSQVSVSMDNKDIFVEGRTSHLTKYAIVQKSVIEEVKANVSPNPFTPASSQYNTCTFTFPNPDYEDVEIKIWDITGVLVKTINPGATSTATWDGRNENGEIVEGGVYIYQIKVGKNRAGKGTIVVAK